MKSHSALYVCAALILIVIFIIEKVTGIFTVTGDGVISGALKVCFKCCKLDETEPAFSCNIYEELRPEVLKKEYEMTDKLKDEKANSFNKLMLKHSAPSGAASTEIQDFDNRAAIHGYFMKRSEKKSEDIKQCLEKMLYEHNMTMQQAGNSTISRFDMLHKKRGNTEKVPLNSLHSYYINDNPDFFMA